MGFSRQKLGPALGWLWYLISRGQSFLPAWYVDSEAGNDNNSGTSPSTPFQTLAKVQSVLQDGDKVRLKRGSHWRETLTLTKEGVDINAYGSGPLPLIDCSDVIPAASWTLTAGKTKVYQASVPIETPNTGATFLNVWEDDAYLVRVASVDECEATPGSYYPSTESESPITLYIHPTGSTNPATNGRRYEYSRRKHAIQTSNNCTVANVRTRRNLDSYGSLYIAPNNVITDCVAEDGGIHNLLVTPPGRLVRVTAKNCYAGSNPLIMFVHFLPVANGEPVEYIGCRAENNQVLPFSTGFGGHRGTSGELGTATYTDCSASNLSSAFTPQQGDAVFERPVLENVTWGFSPSGGQTYAITGASGTVTDRFVSIVSGSGSVVVVEDSQINASMSSGLGFVCTVAGNSIICRDSEINARSALLMSQAGTAQMLRNTINAGAIYVYSIVSGVNLESDHNNFTGITLFTIDGQSKTIDEYRSITGQDQNSLPPPDPGSSDLPTQNLVNLISFGINPTEASGEWYSPKRNLLVQSENLTDSSWAKVGAGTGTAPTVTAGQPDPDGGNSAFRIVMNRGAGEASSDASIIREQAIIPVITDLCASMWVRSFDGSSSYAVALTPNPGNLPFPVVTVTGEWQELSTSGVGNGYEISLRGGQGTSQTADILVWHPQLTAGSSPIPYEKTTLNQTMWDWSPNAAHGTRGNAGTPDSFDPRFLLVGGKISGLEFVTDDQVITSNLSGVSMSGDWTAYVVGKFNGSSGYVWSMAATSVSAYQGIFYSGGLKIVSRNGAAQQISSTALAVPANNYVALALVSSGGTITLKRLDTGATVTIANQNPAGTPRLGFGILAISSPGSAADALSLVYTALYAAAHEDAVQNTVYDILKQRALSERAVSVL